jgi:hypothetical protein
MPKRAFPRVVLNKNSKIASTGAKKRGRVNKAIK